MTVTIGTLIGIFTMIPLAGILGLWLFDEWKFWKTPFVPTKDISITCEICFHKFFCSKDEVIAECPQCKSLNKLKPV